MSIIKPRSHCFSCKAPIRALDNIPIIGYFLLGGKCKNCGAEFPSRYAFVEVITALLTIIIFLIYGLTNSFLIYLALVYLLIAITFVDIDHFIIPNGFILTGLVILFLGMQFGWISIDWIDAASGAFVFAGFLFHHRSHWTIYS